MFTMFVCDPWESYLLQLQADSDREWLEREREEDLDREQELMDELFCRDEDGPEPDFEIDDDGEIVDTDEAPVYDVYEEEEWPWYSEKPYETQESEEWTV
jgi:hypothetical protein